MAASDRAELNFGDLGVQYYVSARCAAQAGLIPVCGNLFHHAVEMLLKARLSQKHSLEELGHKPFGHRLPALWTAFKAEFSTIDLGAFDLVIGGKDQVRRVPVSIASMDRTFCVPSVLVDKPR